MERLKKCARAAGLVDNWRASGWPDLFHPTTGDDFECNENANGRHFWRKPVVLPVKRVDRNERESAGSL